jgi:DnaJ-class molecular chaperone
MESDKPKEAVAEIRCPTCNGTGFPKVKQPIQPGHRIYPPPCKECAGKGRINDAKVIPK